MNQRFSLGVTLLLVSFGCSNQAIHKDRQRCTVELLVLGTAQDAGAPQIGNHNDPAWHDHSQKRLATALALVDHELEQRYLFEATPDIREQLYRLDQHIQFEKPKPGLDGIFLTHAHIGHYTGLMFFGHESMGTIGLSVYVMPRMTEYLSNNGPWDQMVRYNNITLKTLTNKKNPKTQRTHHSDTLPCAAPGRVLRNCGLSFRDA